MHIDELKAVKKYRNKKGEVVNVRYVQTETLFAGGLHLLHDDENNRTYRLTDEQVIAGRVE